MSSKTETATFAGGCFWCLEAVYELLEGVTDVKSGYAGGYTDNPTYEQVCSGATGHAEVVQVIYDPERIAFGDLLDVFFAIHDPTALNRQGADVGTQYRSAIFTADDEQRAAAERKIEEITEAGLWDDPAEDYHDDYFRRNPNQPYCQAVVAPKVAKFRSEHLQRLKREVRA